MEYLVIAIAVVVFWICVAIFSKKIKKVPPRYEGETSEHYEERLREYRRNKI